MLRKSIRLFPGTHVRSCYRARWYGIVEKEIEYQNNYNRDNYIVLIKVTHDRNHMLMRKPIFAILSTAWLEVQ